MTLSQKNKNALKGVTIERIPSKSFKPKQKHPQQVLSL